MKKKKPVLKDITKHVAKAIHKDQTKSPKRLSKAAVAVIDIEPAKKKSDFWDEPEATGGTPFIVETPAQRKKSIADAVAEVAKALPPLPAKFQAAVTPTGFFALRCGEDRVTIIKSIGTKDVLCWHHRLDCVMHLIRDDLTPKDQVDISCQFLSTLNS